MTCRDPKAENNEKRKPAVQDVGSKPRTYTQPRRGDASPDVNLVVFVRQCKIRGDGEYIPGRFGFLVRQAREMKAEEMKERPGSEQVASERRGAHAQHTHDEGGGDVDIVFFKRRMRYVAKIERGREELHAHTHSKPSVTGEDVALPS